MQVKNYWPVTLAAISWYLFHKILNSYVNRYIWFDNDKILLLLSVFEEVPAISAVIVCIFSY